MIQSAQGAKALWLARAYYFFYFGAVGAYFPYINLYFEGRGLNGAAIGVLAAISPIVLIVAGPLWGGLGDRFRAHRALLPIATFGPIAPILLISRFNQFEILIALVASSALFAMAIGPLIDSAVVELVRGTRYSYGSIRVWGSIGFILNVTTVGALARSASLSLIFAVYALNMLLGGLVAIGLPPRRQTLKTSFSASLQQLLAQRAFGLFLCGSFLIGAASYAAFSFFPLQLQRLGASTALIGFASALAAVTETPTLFFANAVLRRLSAWGSLVMAAGVYAVRWTLVALAAGPAYATATQLLHGISFASFLIGGVAYVEEHTPPGLGATAQAVFTATMFGLGAALGALAGGRLFDALAGTGFFLAVALTTLGGLAFIIAAGRRK
jgi:PPP family 3-phenylpropionic acid transporter